MKNFRLTVIQALLPHTILSFLEEKSLHGYAIISIMRKKYHVYFGASTIYPLLNDLEHDGLIMSRWNIAGKRPRKIYEITPKGQAWLVQTDTALESENIIELRVEE